jgi:chemotaxis methyl-accepting protein methylase
MMKKTITNLLLQKFKIDVLKYENSFFQKSLAKRISDTYCESEEAYCVFLEQSYIENQLFAESLNVSYSEFFRNPLTFSVLEKVFLPSRVIRSSKNKQNEIRIWSAACAEGQETYSLAMLLHELNAARAEKINFRIFATDCSEKQIAIAQKGQFSELEINNLSLKRIHQWFDKQGDVYIVKDELRENIEFSTFDLFNEEFMCPPSSIFGDFDLVICANLLFYYKPQYQNIILKKVAHSLAKNGVLITGETEREILMHNFFEEVYPQSAIFKIIDSKPFRP